jgi:hypothetical protein
MTRKQRILTTTAVTAFALTVSMIAYDRAKGNVPSAAPASGAQVEQSNTSSALPGDSEPLALAGVSRVSR